MILEKPRGSQSTILLPNHWFGTWARPAKSTICFAMSTKSTIFEFARASYFHEFVCPGMKIHGFRNSSSQSKSMILQSYQIIDLGARQSKQNLWLCLPWHAKSWFEISPRLAKSTILNALACKILDLEVARAAKSMILFPWPAKSWTR